MLNRIKRTNNIEEKVDLQSNLELYNTIFYYTLKNMWGLLILLKTAGFIYLRKSTVHPGSIC